MKQAHACVVPVLVKALRVQGCAECILCTCAMQTPREASSLGSPRVGYVVVSEGHAVRAGYRCKVSCSHVTEATKPKLRTGTASSSEHVSGNSVHDSYPRELPWDGWRHGAVE